MRHLTLRTTVTAIGLCAILLGSSSGCETTGDTDGPTDVSGEDAPPVDASGLDALSVDVSAGDPRAGAACRTEGDDDFQATCRGDDLLYCVCDEWEGDTCPARAGTWVRQDILCTCAEYMDGRCPVE